MHQEILSLRSDVQELTKSSARLETLITESVIEEMRSIRERLNKHSTRLDDLEKAKYGAITIKNAVVWFIGFLLTAISVGIGVATFIIERIAKGG